MKETLFEVYSENDKYFVRMPVEAEHPDFIQPFDKYTDALRFVSEVICGGL